MDIAISPSVVLFDSRIQTRVKILSHITRYLHTRYARASSKVFLEGLLTVEFILTQIAFEATISCLEIAPVEPVN